MSILNSRFRISNFKPRLSNLAVFIWATLRSPKTTGVLLALLVVDLLLVLIIPQQPTPATTAAARSLWIASLPAPVQLWGDLLFSLRLAQILQSLWFWLPLALLLLNSLLALADYGPGSWQRLARTTPPVEWQHPLTRRIEQSIRLSEPPRELLEALKGALIEKGFFLYETTDGDQRIIGAGRWSWSWLTPLSFYSGLIVFIMAFLISHYFLQTDQLTLVPLESGSSRLFRGSFELIAIDAGRGIGTIRYTPVGREAVPQLLTWRLYQPAFFRTSLILPMAMEPILTVEVRDHSGALLRLIPSQENLSPAERLYLPLSETNSPLYFLIPSAALAFQISPEPASENLYNVQLRRGSALAPSESLNVRAGEAFAIDSLSMLLSLNHNLKVVAHHDPALPLYLIGVVLVVASLLIFWRPPCQVWLAPEVKGRGGRIYGLVEGFGFTGQGLEFLDKLFAVESSKKEAD